MPFDSQSCPSRTRPARLRWLFTLSFVHPRRNESWTGDVEPNEQGHGFRGAALPNPVRPPKHEPVRVIGGPFAEWVAACPSHDREPVGASPVPQASLAWSKMRAAVTAAEAFVSYSARAARPSAARLSGD